MTFKRTQIYLDPEEHRRLVREAAERGLSLTAYLRHVIGGRAGEQAVRYDAHSWNGIVGIIDSAGGHGSSDADREAAQAFEEEHRRSMRRPNRPKKSGSPRP